MDEKKDTEKPKLGTDSSPSHITSHPFTPRSGKEWFKTCKVCDLAEAAHKETLHAPTK